VTLVVVSRKSNSTQIQGDHHYVDFLEQKYHQGGNKDAGLWTAKVMLDRKIARVGLSSRGPP
jgi:hypothetical protein